ncbi:hypothetical protein [Motilimonas eburnea]|uniref:hypothetical protein n=1 Tax=Motilimonas eburnea TaxID=1737488 RepID=UPI001E403B3A|nr:hypothetical protein [Motilimonas eburnea]MCE2571864.1 hypothetical protein [Motilimonas eburnea]
MILNVALQNYDDEMLAQFCQTSSVSLEFLNAILSEIIRCNDDAIDLLDDDSLEEACSKAGLCLYDYTAFSNDVDDFVDELLNDDERYKSLDSASGHGLWDSVFVLNPFPMILADDGIFVAKTADVRALVNQKLERLLRAQQANLDHDTLVAACCEKISSINEVSCFDVPRHHAHLIPAFLCYFSDHPYSFKPKPDFFEFVYETDNGAHSLYAAFAKDAGGFTFFGLERWLAETGIERDVFDSVCTTEA